MTESRHLALLRCPFLLCSRCLAASNDPLLLGPDIRHDYEHEYKEEEKKKERGWRWWEGEEREAKKRTRKIQETEGVQAGKRGIVIGSVPIPPGRYDDLKFNAMKGLPPLLFLSTLPPSSPTSSSARFRPRPTR